jgi:diacylglycerol kinase (ATP)
VQITLIHSPDAGDGYPAPGELMSMLRDAGNEVRYQSTGAAWERALQWPADLVVAAGGDGTVGKVIRELLGGPVPLAVLPLGTANNIATSLGLDADARRAVAGWPGALVRHLDVWRVAVGEADRLMVEALGGGILADLMARSGEVEAGEPSVSDETDRALGALAEVIRTADAAPWRIEVDGRDVSGDYLAVEALNIPLVGPNVSLSPDAAWDDGLLDVVLVTAEDRTALERHVASRLHGDEVKPLSPIPLRGSHVRFVPPSNARLHLDDSEWDPPSAGAEGDRAVELSRAGSVPLLIGR